MWTLFAWFERSRIVMKGKLLGEEFSCHWTIMLLFQAKPGGNIFKKMSNTASLCLEMALLFIGTVSIGLQHVSVALRTILYAKLHWDKQCVCILSVSERWRLISDSNCYTPTHWYVTPIEHKRLSKKHFGRPDFSLHLLHYPYLFIREYFVLLTSLWNLLVIC